MPETRRLFALDQCFPRNILTPLHEALREAELVWIGDIDGRLPTVEDWEVLRALHHHERKWDGLITSDAKLLRIPRVLAVLCQTKLTLVVAESATHDPLRATGLLLTHLPDVCKRTGPSTPQVWRLQARPGRAERPWDHLGRLAKAASRPVQQYYREHQLTPSEFATNPLGQR